MTTETQMTTSEALEKAVQRDERIERLRSDIAVLERKIKERNNSWYRREDGVIQFNSAPWTLEDSLLYQMRRELEILEDAQ